MVDARIMRYVATAEARRAGSSADRAEHRCHRPAEQLLQPLVAAQGQLLERCRRGAWYQRLDAVGNLRG